MFIKSVLQSLVILSVLILTSCSQPDNPTSLSAQNEEETIFAKPGGGATSYTAVHTAYNHPTSYISGTVSGMKPGQNPPSISKSNAQVTFDGFIAEKIRAVTPIGQSGSLTLTGGITIWNATYIGPTKASWLFTFRWPQTKNGTLYEVRIGGINSAYQGTISGTFPAPATIVFDTQPFQIEQGSNTLWSYSAWGNDPAKAVSFQIVTSTP